MVARNPARYLAPAALVAVIVATALIVAAGTGSSDHGAATRPAQRLPAVHRTAPTKTFYVVQAGDSLSGISVKTGVSVPTLEALNPTVDPNTLQTGQRLRLRR